MFSSLQMPNSAISTPGGSLSLPTPRSVRDQQGSQVEMQSLIREDSLDARDVDERSAATDAHEIDLDSCSEGRFQLSERRPSQNVIKVVGTALSRVFRLDRIISEPFLMWALVIGLACLIVLTIFLSAFAFPDSYANAVTDCNGCSIVQCDGFFPFSLLLFVSHPLWLACHCQSLEVRSTVIVAGIMAGSVVFNLFFSYLLRKVHFHWQLPSSLLTRSLHSKGTR